MDTAIETTKQKQIGRWVLMGVVTAAVLALLLVIYEVDRSPRTDDASVWANYIEIAPEVSGRLVELPIKDNQFVKKGNLLFVIDPRPYEYALQQALSRQRSRVRAQSSVQDSRRLHERSHVAQYQTGYG
jgi:multidrug efflux system membrane fusion protein